ncbi:MAG: hypothetical protein ACI8VC_000775 [Candidatus Endobugula sp.]|jgi:hypothetical protein
MGMRDYSEQRISARVKTYMSAAIVVQQEGIVSHACCHDLSASGVLLTVDKEFSIGSELLVTLTPGTSISGELIARCTIARSQLTPEDKYFLSLEIQEIIDNEGFAMKSHRKAG